MFIKYSKGTIKEVHKDAKDAIDKTEEDKDSLKEEEKDTQEDSNDS